MKRMLYVLLLSAFTMSAVCAVAQDEPRKQCTALTVKKVQCKNKAQAGKEVCAIHDKDRQCGAPTSKGTPCKLPKGASGKCWRHS